MIKVSFFIDKPKANNTVLMVRVFPGNIKASTGISLNPKHWEHQKQTISTKHPYYDVLRPRLKEIESRLFNELSKLEFSGEGYNLQDVKRIINPNALVKAGGPVSVKEYYEQWKAEYIEKKNRGNKTGKKLGVNYTRVQKQVVEKLEAFKPNLKPKEINRAFIDKYVAYLYDTSELQDETINRHLKFLRLILNYAELPNNFIQLLSIEANESFDLYWKEVIQLRDATYSSIEVQKAAHTFVIDCQLCLRWSDLSSLKPEHIINVHSEKYGWIEVINMSQGKTGNQVYIPIPPMAKKLIEKYGQIPIPRTSTGNPNYDLYNDNLKIAAQEAGLVRKVQQSKSRNGIKEFTQEPLHAVLSTHNARHTAASRIFEVTRNEALKERLLGHKKKADPYTKVPGVALAEDLLDAWAILET